jgi:hypothetical protein
MLTLPQVLQLYRHDQGLTRLAIAREAGLCPHCYEHLEAGRAVLSRHALESLYVRLPVIAALMSDVAIPLPPEAARTLVRLRTQILSLERLDDESQAVELMRVRLQLQWQDQAAAATGETSTRSMSEATEGPTS